MIKSEVAKKERSQETTLSFFVVICSAFRGYFFLKSFKNLK